VRVSTVLPVAVSLIAAYMLKSFHSRAGSEDLGWILAPTAAVLSWVTDHPFVAEPGVGYVSRDLLYAVVPSCAGVNFLVVAFVSLVVGLAPARRTVAGGVLVLPAAAATAWITTVLANVTRLAVAIPLHRSGVSLGPLTSERIHHLEGTIVYVLFLTTMFALALRGSDRAGA